MLVHAFVHAKFTTHCILNIIDTDYQTTQYCIEMKITDIYHHYEAT